MAYPILAEGYTWWGPNISTITRDSITEIEIKDSYTPDSSVVVVDSWDASAAKDGSITCYVIGTKLFIAGNGSGKIAANEVSSNAFGSVNGTLQFKKITSFKGLNLLDVSNCRRMHSMFMGAALLTSIDLSGWDTKNVTSTAQMFAMCRALTQLDLSHFNTSNVTEMRSMFGYCIKLTSLEGLSNWDISNVTDAFGLFSGCTILPSINGISNWDTSKITNMKNIFSGCKALTSIDISNWDTSNVEDLSVAFAYCDNLTTVDLSKWDVSKVTTINAMFGKCPKLTSVDLSNWDVSKIEDMYDVFMSCENLTSVGDLSNWQTSSLKYTGGMFQGCYILDSIGDLSNWDFSKVEKAQAMFYLCKKLTFIGDLSKWNTSSVTDMSQMFCKCNCLKKLDLSNWNVSNVTTMKCMFEDCPKLTEIGDLANWDTSSVTDLSFMFWGASSIGEIDVSKWDVSKVTTFDHFAAHAGLRRKGIENWNTSSAVNMNAMFHNCAEEELDLSGYDVSKVEVFSQMFENSPNLKRIKGMEKWDTSACWDFSGMFERCSKLEELDLSAFDTSKAKNGVVNSGNNGTSATLNNMFLSCNNLKKVTVGSNFSINGDGTNTSAANMAILPTPSADYITGADGMWYTFNGDAYAPDAMKDRTAETYYASYDIVANMDVICKNGSLLDAAKAIREKNGSTERYTPAQFGAAIRALN